MSIDRLNAIIAEIKATRQNYDTAQEALKNNPDYSQEFKQRTADANHDKLLREMARLGTEANTVRTTMTAARPPAGAADVLAEMQQQQAWQRLRPQLDAGRSVDELLAEAKASGDATAVRALRAEGPAYFSAKIAGRSDGHDHGEQERTATLAELQQQTDIALGVVGSGAERYEARDRARLAALWPQLDAHLGGANAYPSPESRVRLGLTETMSTTALEQLEQQFA